MLVFLTDHPGFIVNISFIHFSVEDDSRLKTNFGMTKKHVFSLRFVYDLAH